jgi:hypothetical protein
MDSHSHRLDYFRPLAKTLLLLLGLITVTVARAELSWDAKERSVTASYGETSGQVSFFCRNLGAKPVVIKNVKTDCSCSEAEISKKNIAPNEGAELTVTMHFLAERSVAETHVIVATDDGATTTLSPQLNRGAPLSVTPSLLSWPSHNSSRVAREMIVEPAKSVPDIADLRVVSSDPLFKLSVAAIPGTRRWQVKVQPPDGDAARVAILTLEARTRDGSVQRVVAFAKVMDELTNN